MFDEDIKKLALENSNFRKVIHTGTHSQLVLMSLKENEDIGLETHNDVDQILFFVQGKVEATLNGEKREVPESGVVFVPAGTEHNFKNIGQTEVKLFTVYSPPEHPDGTIHQTKADANWLFAQQI